MHGMLLTKNDPGGQESLADPDDWPAADPGPGLSLQCLSSTSAVSLQNSDASHNRKQQSSLYSTWDIKSNNLGLNTIQLTGIFCNNFIE